MSGQPLQVEVPVMLSFDPKEIHRLFIERGIRRNKRNVQRFLRQMRKAQIRIDVPYEDFSLTFPFDREWLLLNGFVLKEE